MNNVILHGRLDNAEKALHSLPNRSPVSNENAYYAARIYAEQGRRVLAVQAIEAALAGDSRFLAQDKAKELLSQLTSTNVETK